MMKNKKKEINANVISSVGQYVFDNSDRVINHDELAALTGFSKYHLNRLFFAATGYQLGEFIQRQKLDKAMYLIREGQHSIINIALCVGYESQASFTRAFKKNFQLTPSEVVAGKTPVNGRAGSLPPKKLFAENNLDPVWKIIPEQTVYGIYGKGFCQQSFSGLAKRLYGQLASMAKTSGFKDVKPIGVSIDNPWVGDQEQSSFFAGFLFGLEQHSEALEVFKWEAGKWACFVHKGAHNTIWQTISQVYAQWVIPNGIKLKDQKIVQLYINNPESTSPEDLETELYFAVHDHEK